MVEFTNTEELLSKIKKGFLTNKVWCCGFDFIVIEDGHALLSLKSEYHSLFDILLLCKSGNQHCRIDGVEYYIEQNMSLVLLRGQHLQIDTVSDDFLFSATLMSKEFSEKLSVGNQYLVYKNVIFRPIVHYTPTLWNNLLCYHSLQVSALRQGLDQKTTLLIVKHFMEALHLQFAGYLHEQHVEQKVGTTRRDALVMQFSDMVMKEAHLHHEVSYYAERLCVTSKHLSESVRKSTNHSASWWIDMHLQQDAENLLTTTRKTIQEISDLLGFSDQSTFGKFFKRKLGVSPIIYRRQHVS